MADITELAEQIIDLYAKYNDEWKEWITKPQSNE
jgi:hypothetical protein